MALTPGTRLGPYEIAAQIGQGGMGEVYRATDTNLKRDVAIKVLPESVAGDAERLARFQREAEVLASLNHPNIAQIHGLEKSAGTIALVMELVEGPTLADRIAQGAIPVDEALPIAKQVAEALEAAHEQGIIHRDLKPANVKLRPDGVVKVLDFGLAKALEPTNAMSPAMSQAPTITTPAMTQAGMILGTAAYMSPEQARGKPVDKRSDVWAFGAVLYEMLTGRRAFGGEGVADTLGAVIHKDADWTRLPPGLSPTLATYIKRCLHKDPKQRVPDIAAMRLALEGAFETSVSPGVRAAAVAQPAFWRRGVPLALAAALAGAAAWNIRPAPPVQSQQVVRFTIPLNPDERLTIQNTLTISSPVVISPDGTRVAYVATGGGVQQIYLRQIDGREARLVPGTEGAFAPFFSPDGQWLGFSTAAGTFKVSLSGGAVLNLGSFAARTGSYWGADGMITLGSGTGLQQVPDGGGTLQPLTRLQVGEGNHRLPDLLPDGRGVLFTAGSTQGRRIAAYSTADGTQRDLIPAGSGPRYSPTGHLVYAQAGTLFAVPFDLNSLNVTGDPTPVLQGVLQTNFGFPYYSFSTTGTLVYVSGDAGATRNFVWVARNGTEEPLAAPAREYDWPRLSPDGRRIAVEVGTQTWIFDTARDTLTRLAFDGTQNDAPTWSPDGTRIAVRSNREGAPPAIFWQMADGSGGQERLSTPTEGGDVPQSFSADGQLIAFHRNDPKTLRDIWVASVTDGERSLFLGTPATEGAPRFSPDGRWMAYVSDESGRPEIYVQPYPGPGGKWQISADSGIEPVWNPNGRELFYRTGNRMMAVQVTTEPTFSPGRPTMLFEGEYLASAFPATSVTYDVTPDGQRFLMIKDVQTASANQINVVVNWFEELRQRVPVN